MQTKLYCLKMLDQVMRGFQRQNINITHKKSETNVCDRCHSINTKQSLDLSVSDFSYKIMATLCA